MFCDLTMPDGSPSWADPRHVLRRTLSKAAEMGFTFYTHPEVEFFLLKDLPVDGTPPQPADNGGYFDLSTHNVAHDFRREAVFALEAMGISVEFSHHEVAPGQQEIDLRYADALSMADNVMTLRHVVREVALAQGVHATFMPKPFTDLAGSAMHTHLSLFEGDRNAFHDAADPMRLSTTAQAVHRRPAHPRPRVHRRHQPDGELLPAAAGRHRGPDGGDLGPGQPLGAGAGALVQAEQGATPPASRCARRTRPATRT